MLFFSFLISFSHCFKYTNTFFKLFHARTYIQYIFCWSNSLSSKCWVRSVKFHFNCNQVSFYEMIIYFSFFFFSFSFFLLSIHSFVIHLIYSFFSLKGLAILHIFLLNPKLFKFNINSIWGYPRGVMVKAMVVREFVLQSRYYIHFRANTLGKGMNPLILPAMG